MRALDAACARVLLAAEILGRRAQAPAIYKAAGLRYHRGTGELQRLHAAHFMVCDHRGWGISRRGEVVAELLRATIVDVASAEAMEKVA